MRHLLWLIKQMVALGFRGDWAGSLEARELIRLHFMYKHKKTKPIKEVEK